MSCLKCVAGIILLYSSKLQYFEAGLVQANYFLIGIRISIAESCFLDTGISETKCLHRCTGYMNEILEFQL